MLETILAFLGLYLYFGGISGILYYIIETKDKNSIRIFFAGLGWPAWIFVGLWWLGKRTRRYFKGKFLQDLQELTAKEQLPILPQQTIIQSDYETGQWR